MRKAALLLFVATVPGVIGLRAQATLQPFEGIVDAIIISERLKNERRLAEAQEAWLRAQAEAARARTERMKRQYEAGQRAIAAARQGNAEVGAAIDRIAARFPDFPRYASTMSELVREFPGRADQPINLDRYLEGIYLIAKYASFSSVAEGRPELGEQK